MSQAKLSSAIDLTTTSSFQADLLLSVHDNSAGMIEPEIKLNTLIFYGEAAFALGKYRKAEKSYSNALQYKKYLMKSKGLSKQIEGQKDILPDSGELVCTFWGKS